MKKIRIGILVLGLILILINLFRIDYDNLAWSNNDDVFMGIVSMLCVIAAMITSIYSDDKKKWKLDNYWIAIIKSICPNNKILNRSNHGEMNISNGFADLQMQKVVF